MMLKRGAVLIVMALLIIIAPAPSTHAEPNDGAGTTGTAFLKVEGGSRPAALGGAFVGLANDINTIFWNPAGLTAIHDRELTAMQHFSFADINNQTIGYAQRVERLVWGASFLGGFTEYERRQHGPTPEPDSTPTVGAFGYRFISRLSSRHSNVSGWYSEDNLGAMGYSKRLWCRGGCRVNLALA